MAYNYGNNDQIFQQAQEKFRSVDAEVIYMVLTECDFNLQQAESSLRELSIHAGDEHPVPTPAVEEHVAGQSSVLTNQPTESYLTEDRNQPPVETTIDNASDRGQQSGYHYLDNLPSVYDSFYLGNNQMSFPTEPPPNIDDLPEEPQQMNPWSTASGDDECSASDVLARLMQGDIEEILRNKQTAQSQIDEAGTQDTQPSLKTAEQRTLDEDYAMNQETIIHDIENLIDEDDKESLNELETVKGNKENIEPEAESSAVEVRVENKEDLMKDDEKPITKIVVNLSSYTNVGYYNGVHLSFNGDTNAPDEVKGLYPPPECKTMFRKKEMKKIKISEAALKYTKEEEEVVQDEKEDDVNGDKSNKNDDKNGIKIKTVIEQGDESSDDSSKEKSSKSEFSGTTLAPNAPEFVAKSNDKFQEPPNLRRSVHEPPTSLGMPHNNPMFPPRPYHHPMPMVYPQRMYGPPPPQFMPLYRNPMIPPGPFQPYSQYPPGPPMYRPNGHNFKPPPGFQRPPMFMNHRMGYRGQMEPYNAPEEPLIGSDGVPVKVMYIMRGLPGSGKSTLARHLKGATGSILSTDDFFINSKGIYEFNPEQISEAHEWNKKRAKKLVQEGISPIVIDNTNCTAWEMKPYAELAIKNCYQVKLREPETPWKYKCGILAQKNVHGVPKDKIRRMLENYEHDLTVEKILKSGSRPSSQNSNETKSYQLSRPQYNTEPPLANNVYNKKGAGPRFNSQNQPGFNSYPQKHTLNQGVSDMAKTKRQKDNSDLSSADTSPHPLSTSTPITNSNQSGFVSRKNQKKSFGLAVSKAQSTVSTATVRNPTTSGPKNIVKKDTRDHEIVKENMRNGNVKLSLEQKAESTHRFPFKNSLKTKSAGVKKKMPKKEDAKQPPPESRNATSSPNPPASSSASSSSSTSSSVGSGSNSEQNSPEILEDDKPPPERDIVPVDIQSNDTSNDKPKENDEEPVTFAKIETDDSEIKPKAGLSLNIHAKAPKPKIAAVFSHEVVMPAEPKESALDKIALNYADTPSVQQSESIKDPFEIQNFILTDDNFTQTDEYDFTLCRKAQVSSVDVEEVKILTGVAERFQPAPLLRDDDKIVEEAKFDKSTMTNELSEESQDTESQTAHDLETLKLLFDDIPEDKLMEVYNDCSKNLDWTTNILAESSIFGNNASISTLIKENHTLHGSHDVMSDYSCCKNVEKVTEENQIVQHDEVAEQSSSKHSVEIESPLIEQPFQELPETQPEVVFSNPRLKQAGTPSTPPSTPQEDMFAGLLLPPVRVRLSKGLIDTLVEVFGDVPEEDGVRGRNYDVSLPHHLAKQLHKTWMDAEMTRRKMQSAARHFTHKQMSSLMAKNGDDRIRTWEMEEARKLHSQLEEDEMFARRLQQAEDRGESEYIKPPLEEAPVSRKLKKFEKRQKQSKTIPLLQPKRTPVHSEQSKVPSAWSPLMNAWSDVQVNANTAVATDIGMSTKPDNGGSNNIRQIINDEIKAQKSQQRQKQNLDQIGLATKLKLEQLREDYPGLPQELLEDIFVANNYDMESTVYAINCLWVDDAQPPGHNIMSEDARRIFDQQVMDNVTSTGVPKKSIPKLQEPLIKLPSSTSETSLSNEDDQYTMTRSYEEHRQNAQELKTKMMEAFHKAKDAFTRNQREMATFYAHQGHEFQRRYKIENEKAADIIYKERNIFRKNKEVDLHGLHVQEAIRILALSISERKKTFQAQNTPPHRRTFNVITGRGLSSHGGISKIRQAVKEWLHANNYKYEFTNPGLIEVKL